MLTHCPPRSKISVPEAVLSGTDNVLPPTLSKKYLILVRKDICNQLYLKKYLLLLVVIKVMDVYEHERLSNITLINT